MIIHIVLQFIASFFGTIAFSIMFFVPRKYYPCCGLIGGFGWITCWIIMHPFGMSYFIASFFGTIAFSIMFFVPRKYYPCCGLIGGFGWITCWIIMHPFGMSYFTGTIVASAVVVLLSRICGVELKCPATLFMLSGLFPLVPGVGIYWTVYSVITGEIVPSGSGSRYLLDCLFCDNWRPYGGFQIWKADVWNGNSYCPWHLFCI